MRSTRFKDVIIIVLQSIFRIILYIPACAITYYIFKIAIFVPMFVLNQYLGYELINRTTLKIITFFLANLFLIYKIVVSTRKDKYEKAREKIKRSVIVEERENGYRTIYIDRK